MCAGRWMLVLIVIGSCLSPSVQRSNEVCNYETSCGISRRECTKRDRHDSSEWPDCLLLKPKSLDSGRGTVKFHANISVDGTSLMLRRFGNNMSYSVVYRLKNREGAAVWGTVGNCCNMKPNGTACDLLPKKKKESFFLIAKGSDGTKCSMLLQERQHLSWCETEESTRCIVQRNGSLFIKEPNMDVSFNDLPLLPTEYFFFRVDRSYANSGGKLIQGIPFKRGVEGMQFLKEKNKVNVSGVELDVEEHVKVDLNVKWQKLVYDLPNNDCRIWCFFSEVETYPPDRSPYCHLPWLQEGYSDKCDSTDDGVKAWHIVIVFVVLAFLIVAMLIVVRCVRAKVNYCLADDGEIEKDIPPHMKEILAGEADDEFLGPTKENPDILPVCIVVGFMRDNTAYDSKDINSNHATVQCNKVLEADDDDRTDENGLKMMKVSRTSGDSGLEEDANDVSSFAGREEPPIGYVMKESAGIAFDSGFGTIGSGFSGSVRSSPEYPGDESSLVWGEEISPLIFSSPSFGPVVENDVIHDSVSKIHPVVSENHPLLTQTRFPDDENVLRDKALSVSDNEHDSLCVVSDGDYQPKVNLSKQSFPGHGGIQSHSSSSCNTGCETSTCCDEIYHVKPVPDDLLQCRNGLPRYIQSSETPNDLCGRADSNHCSSPPAYMSK